MQIAKSIKIVRDKKLPNTIDLEIIGESHTLGNLLSDRLLSDKRCTYAAYKVPHPLDDKVVIRVSAERGSDDVVGLVNETIKSIVNDIDEIVKRIDENERNCDN